MHRLCSPWSHDKKLRVCWRQPYKRLPPLPVLIFTTCPSCLLVYRCASSPSAASLHTNYRNPPHLTLIISQLFYHGGLKYDPHALSPSGALYQKKRAVGWLDVSGTTNNANLAERAQVSAGGSWSNPSEIHALARVWDHYMSGGVFEPRDVLIVCMHEAQRREILRTAPFLAPRVVSVEYAVGHEFPIVFVLLSAPACRIISVIRAAHWVH